MNTFAECISEPYYLSLIPPESNLAPATSEGTGDLLTD